MGRVDGNAHVTGWMKTQGGAIWVSHASSQVGGVVFLFCCSSRLVGLGLVCLCLHPRARSHAELWGLCLLLRKALCSHGACDSCLRQPGSEGPHFFIIVACLSLLCTAVINTLTKCNLERAKGSFHLPAYKSITEGSQVKNLEARTKAEAMEEDSSWFA